jgi:hypothetical protein
VLRRDTLDAVPTPKNLQSFATLTLGANISSPQYQDVGGNRGEQAGVGGFIIHNNRNNDGRSMIDGMPYGPLIGELSSQNQSTFVNQLIVQETTLTTGGATAEIQTGGVVINVVPKDGGNVFSGTLMANGSTSGMQASNLSSDIAARGDTTATGIIHIYDVGGALGGPIVKDKLWFFQADRWWDTKTTVPGFYFDATPHTFAYTPNLSQPEYFDIPHRENNIRLTWQVASKHKIHIAESLQSACNCYYSNIGTLTEPEATANLHFYPQYLTQATWTYTATNRLLFEAGNSTLIENQDNVPVPGVLPTDIPLVETTTGVAYNARATNVLGQTDYGIGNRNDQSNQRLSMSYVTGSHAFKVGLYVMEGFNKTTNLENTIPGLGPVSYNLRNGLPLQIVEYSSPETVKYRLWPDLGIYGQDQWTMKKLTLNLGVRFDYDQQYAPAISEPAIPQFGIPVRDFPEVRNVPNYKDISPRLGAAYDVFGNGKTAIKASIGRYVLSQVSSLGLSNAAAGRISTSVTRSWTDGNGNFVPDCNLANPLANGECGVISNLSFGQSIAATTYDAGWITGFGTRPYTWQDSVALQQELRPGLALNVGYFNTWYGNFSVTANQDYAPGNFTSFCVTAPTSAAVPLVPSSIAGQQVCGFVDPNFAVVTNNHVQQAANFGKQYEHYNGVDVGVNWRFGKGGLIMGGISTGQTVTDNCAIVDANPQIAFSVGTSSTPSRTNTAFCHVVLPWSAQTQTKVAWNVRWATTSKSAAHSRICRGFRFSRRRPSHRPERRDLVGTSWPGLRRLHCSHQIRCSKIA